MIHFLPRLRGVVLLLPLLATGVLAQSTAQPPRQGPPPQSTGGVSPAPWNWWKPGSEFNEKLHLTKAQSDEIQRVYDSGMRIVREKNEELQRQLEKLSKINRPDETMDVITMQVERVEASRSAANKERTLMLIRMRRVLTADQMQRFEGLATKWMKDMDQNQQRPQARPNSTGPQNDSRAGRPGGL
ncbi:MAG TPA: hypothetical protein VJP86_18315 [Vicinamibacterales bacterium]|jgi:Spy/CpxP family protein refolding chaperone|nr:hypothetical protein [Vicinamibacterales bacterium]